MTNLINLAQMSNEQKYTSKFLVEQINQLRKIEGNETELLHKSLLTKIEKEFEAEINEQNILPVEIKDLKGEFRKAYELTFEESLQLLMSESKTVRKGCIQVMKAKIKPKTRLELARENLILIENIELLEQKVENLDTVLDNLLEWVSIIKVAKFNKISENTFEWRKLKSKSEELGYLIKKAESPRFGFQNLYHIDCFKSCYPQFNYNLK
jgi:hypothetical protein